MGHRVSAVPSASEESPSRLGQVGARRASADIGLQLVGRVANIALGIAVTVVLVRALGDTRFGQWSTLFAVAQIAGYIGDLGLGQIAVRKAAEEPHRERVWIGGLLSLRLLLSGPAVALTVGVSLVLSTDAEMRVSAVVLATTIVASAITALSAVFQLRIRNSLTAAFELANGLLWGAAVFVLAALDAGIVAFAVAFAAVAAIVAALQAAFAAREVPLVLRGTRAQWPELIRVGLPVAISGLLILSYGRIDQVLVFELDGERGAGLYGAAYRVIDRAQMLPATIMATLFPLIAAAHPADPLRVRQLVQVSLDLLIGVALPVFAFTAAASGPLVLLLFGEEFREVDTALVVLTGGYILTAVGFLCGFVIIVLSLQRRFLRYAAIGLVMNVALNLLLIPRYGYIAAAWVIGATQVVVIGLSLRLIFSELHQRLRVGRLARIAVAAAAMGALVVVGDGAGLPIGVLMLVAVASYAVLLLLLRAVTAAEVRLLARRGG